MVDLEKEPLFGLVELDGADHPFVPLQRDHQYRAQLALRRKAAAIGLSIAIGEQHLVLGDGAHGDG